MPEGLDAGEFAGGEGGEEGAVRGAGDVGDCPGGVVLEGGREERGKERGKERVSLS